jgi:hypothetical protein
MATARSSSAVPRRHYIRPGIDLRQHDSHLVSLFQAGRVSGVLAMQAGLLIIGVRSQEMEENPPFVKSAQSGDATGGYFRYIYSIRIISYSLG